MFRRITPLILVIILFLPLGLSAGQATEPTTWPSDNPFGVIESYDDPAAAGELGVSWTRITFHWAEIQPDSPEQWLSDFDETHIDAELAAGRQILGLLIGIPDWARDERRLPLGLRMAHDEAGNSWAGFVREAVGRYAGRIDHWVIWNEPDISASEIAHTWDGSVADFAHLQRTAYLVAKEVNPHSVVHLAAFTYWADYYAGTDQYMARLLDEIMADPAAMAHNHYFDVATAHLYFQPNQIYDLLSLFIAIMRDRGLPQPIWLVETNAPPRDDPAWPVPNWTLSVGLDEQAAFVPQALASALAAGVEKVGLYKLKDTNDDRKANPEPFGLIRQDGSRRPAFNTYQEAIKRLSGAFRAERERWNEVGQIRLEQEGQTTTVLFARLPFPQMAQIQATAAEALLIDMWGNSQEINASGGEFEVSLPAALCSQPIGDYCMIGGTVYYLVQAADVSRPTPTPTQTSIPTEMPSPTATVMPTNTLPPAATITATPTHKPQPLTVADSSPEAQDQVVSTPVAAIESQSPATAPGDADLSNMPNAENSRPGWSAILTAAVFIGGLVAIGILVWRRGRSG